MKFLAKWRIRKPADDAETVYVSERFGVRSLHIGSDTVQSSMRIGRPTDLELSYTRSMMAFLLFQERPARVVMVGLGGGSLPKFVYHRMPWATVEVVEINPRVVAIARQYFHVPENDDRFTVLIDDGARYMAAEGGKADVIAVDGYDGESAVEVLCSRSFYESCHRRLSARGLLVVNLWGSDRAFNETLQRIEAAFPEGTLCLPAEKPGNIIVFAFNHSPEKLAWTDLRQHAAELERRYQLEFVRFVSGLRRMNRCDDRHIYV